MKHAVSGIVGLVVLLVAKSAWAAFHLMKVVEVFPGTMGQPNAQYVKLQMYAANQNFVGTHKVTVYDAAGTQVMAYTFATQVANGGVQANILVATAEAGALFGITPDLVMTPTIARAGGKVCFDAIPEDCVAWGNYTGSLVGIGKPAYQARGLIYGRALTRKLGTNGTLEAADDTDVATDDFADAAPVFKNNGNGVGTNPTSTCGNNAIEGLESCDDNNTASNDGCSSACITESCGDGVVQTSEQCDDTNTNNGDACSSTCMVQTPAPDDPAFDGPPIGDDASNTNPNNGGGGGCCQTGGAGLSPLLALGVLALLARRRR